jgi:RNA polymerase sigma-70 factor (ECF subfamily)
MNSNGDPGFQRIHSAYYTKVRSYAAKLIGRDEADDVAQEVFVKVSRALDTLADPARLASWIYAITLNTVRDTARARASRPSASPGGVEDLADVPDPAARTPEETAARDEMVACYVDYVRRLPRDYYDVYVLAEFDHLPSAEIARRLSLPLPTVKMRLHRARVRLHEALRQNCRCYYNERGELMGEPKPRQTASTVAGAASTHGAETRAARRSRA